MRKNERELFVIEPALFGHIQERITGREQFDVNIGGKVRSVENAGFDGGWPLNTRLNSSGRWMTARGTYWYAPLIWR